MPNEESLDPTMIREAQRVVGELVWLSTKSRPDLMYAISKMSSAITRNPQQVIEMGRTVWAFLAETFNHGLRYQINETAKDLNVYTDSSFSEVCHGCFLIMWSSGLLLWKSSKQGIISVSTAESELIELMDGACAGDAVKVVLEELIGGAVRATSFTDNAATVSIVTSESGSWRTRHLKKRAHVLKARISGGEWLVRYQAGVDMPADIGTKVLAFERFRILKEIMGMCTEESGKTPQKSPACKTLCLNRSDWKFALQALILAAKLAQAKGVGEISVYGEKFYDQPIKSVQLVDLDLVVIATLTIMLIGMLIGSCLTRMWDRSQSRVGDFGNRPSFLDGEESWLSRFYARQVKKERQGVSAADGSSAAAAGSSSAAAAGNLAAGSSALAAGGSSAVAAGNLAAGSSALAAGGSLAVAAGNLAAGGSSALAAGGSLAVAAGNLAADSSSAVAAGNLAAGSSAATSGHLAAGGSSTVAAGNLAAASSNGPAAVVVNRDGGALRQRRSRTHEKEMYISQTGEKVHVSRLCHGLRKARQIFMIQFCPVCVLPGHQFEDTMFSTGEGDSLHKDRIHLRDCGRNDPIRNFQPCSLCYR